MRAKLGLGLQLLAAVLVALGLLIELPWWMLIVVGMLAVLGIRVTHVGQQTRSVMRLGIATPPRRLGSSVAVVVAIAGVVGVMVSVLGMCTGLVATLERAGTDDTAIVIRAGAQSEIDSEIDHLTTIVVSLAPQVLKNAQGQPIVSSELIVAASLPRKRAGVDANVELRGVGERVWELRPNIRITAGRKPAPGTHELVVGKDAGEQFAGLELGSTVTLSGESWRVVGAFEAGDYHNSEIWGDTAVVGSAYRHGSSKASITVRLTDAAAFGPFKARLTGDPRLQVDVQTTRDYYRRQSDRLSRMLRFFGNTVGLIMGIGATAGALNTMYGAVAARPREIAALRAMGFQGMPLVISVLFEAMLLALLGGAIGEALAWASFANFTSSSLDENDAQVVFAFKISPALLGSGLKWALAIGFLGGLFPALRAVHVPVAEGLRDL